MAFFKQVWVFSFGANSWSEIYYQSANSIADSALFPDAFINLRLAMLHQDAELTKIRVSDTLNLRATVPVPINRGGSPEIKGPPDVTNTAAVLTLNSTERAASRKVWMRGLPDNYVVRDDAGNDILLTQFAKAIRNWCTGLAARAYQIPSLSKVGVPPTQPNVYTKIIQAAPTAMANTTTLTINNTYTAQPNGRIIISRCSPKQLPGINGHWTATAGADATHIVIPYVMPSTNSVTLNNGVLRPEIFGYGVINALTSGFAFFRSRKTGKSFLGGRGRRTAVRLRSL